MQYNNQLTQQVMTATAMRRGLKPTVAGVGINDLTKVRNVLSYKVWKNMIERCYLPAYQNRFPSYKGVEVCKAWKTYSNFKVWFDKNYVEGSDLDKDILTKDCRIYSPETCIFVPHSINVALRRVKSKNSTISEHLPIGIQKSGKKYRTCGYRFDNLKEAFNFYCDHKRKIVVDRAYIAYSEKRIDKRTFNAIIEYCLSNY